MELGLTMNNRRQNKKLHKAIKKKAKELGAVTGLTLEIHPGPDAWGPCRYEWFLVDHDRPVNRWNENSEWPGQPKGTKDFYNGPIYCEEYAFSKFTARLFAKFKARKIHKGLGPPAPTVEEI